MDALLKTYSTALNIDVTGSYNSVDPIEMAKALYNKDFTQLSQITDTFNKTLPTLPLIDSILL